MELRTNTTGISGSVDLSIRIPNLTNSEDVQAQFSYNVTIYHDAGNEESVSHRGS